MLNENGETIKHLLGVKESSLAAGRGSTIKLRKNKNISLNLIFSHLLLETK